jgi:hypothetical protein
VLILGQVTGDASISGVVNIWGWYQETAVALKKAGHEVRFRKHPKEPQRRVLPTMKQVGGTLDEALAKAKWAVTFNSNSGVDAVLAGTPAVTINKGSMAWAVTGHKPTEPPPMPDRTAWAYRIAYCQWSLDEIRNGDAWEHLKVGMQQEVAA